MTSRKSVSLCGALVVVGAGTCVQWLLSTRATFRSRLRAAICQAVDLSIARGSVTASPDQLSVLVSDQWWIDPESRRQAAAALAHINAQSSFDDQFRILSDQNRALLKTFDSTLSSATIQSMAAEAGKMVSRSDRVHALVESNFNSFIHLCQRHGK